MAGIDEIIGDGISDANLYKEENLKYIQRMTSQLRPN